MKQLISFLKVVWALFSLGFALFVSSVLVEIHIPQGLALIGALFVFVFVLLFGLVILDYPLDSNSEKRSQN